MTDDKDPEDLSNEDLAKVQGGITMDNGIKKGITMDNGIKQAGKNITMDNGIKSSARIIPETPIPGKK